MTNQQQIEQTIQKDYIDFNNSLYPDPLPKDIIEYFKLALMEKAPNDQKTPAKVLEVVTGKKPSELTFFEVGLVINTVLSIPMKVLFTDIKKALKEIKVLQELTVDYNLKVKAKEEELLERKSNLLSLSGISNSRAFMSKA